MKRGICLHFRAPALSAWLFLLSSGSLHAADCAPDSPTPQAITQLSDAVRQIRGQYGVLPDRIDCIQNPQDPFDPGAVMKDGKHQGECSDSSTNRPPVILRENDDEIEVANFKHGGKWWIATIPKNGVDRAIFQTAFFDVGVPLITIAHTQMRLLMKPGQEILLKSQIPGKQEHSIINDFIITSNVHAPKNVPFDFFNAMRPNYGILTRLQSTDDRVIEEIVKDQSEIQQRELNFTDAEKRKFLETSIRQAAQDWYSQTYDIFNNNCTTKLFDVIDRVHPKSDEVDPFRVGILNLLDAVNKPSVNALRERKLNDQGQIEHMNGEMGDASMQLKILGNHDPEAVKKVLEELSNR